jgi:hypothetical protein
MAEGLSRDALEALEKQSSLRANEIDSMSGESTAFERSVSPFSDSVKANREDSPAL